MIKWMYTKAIQSFKFGLTRKGVGLYDFMAIFRRLSTSIETPST